MSYEQEIEQMYAEAMADISDWRRSAIRSKVDLLRQQRGQMEAERDTARSYNSEHMQMSQRWKERAEAAEAKLSGHYTAQPSGDSGQTEPATPTGEPLNETYRRPVGRLWATSLEEFRRMFSSSTTGRVHRMVTDYINELETKEHILFREVTYLLNQIAERDAEIVRLMTTVGQTKSRLTATIRMMEGMDNADKS